MDDEDEDCVIYQIEERTNYQIIDNDIPIYNKILENEYIKNYELYKRIGGDLIAIKTDNKIVENPKNQFVSDDSSIGGYKEGDIQNITFTSKKSNKELTLDFDDWNDFKEDEFENYEDIVNQILDKNQSFRVQGDAGF
eukprot:gene32577-41387_t